MKKDLKHFRVRTFLANIKGTNMEKAVILGVVNALVVLGGMYAVTHIYARDIAECQVQKTQIIFTCLESLEKCK